MSQSKYHFSGTCGFCNKFIPEDSEYGKCDITGCVWHSTHRCTVDATKKNVLSDFATCQLVEELKERDGVITSQIGPESEITVTTKGPAIVFVVID